jgi:dephospho-CoA kinase
VSRVIADDGGAIVDMDILSRDAVLPGTRAYRAILDTFGRDVLNPDGTLDRGKLRAVVFSDNRKRKQLNSIMRWPLMLLMFQHIFRQFFLRRKRVVVLDAALLVESGLYYLCSSVVVVSTPPEVQLQRLMNRDQMSREAALRIITAQAPLQAKLDRATVVIDGSLPLAEMQEAARACWREERRTVALFPPSLSLLSPTVFSFLLSGAIVAIGSLSYSLAMLASRKSS